MKYYFVFGYDRYYPQGGMNDFLKSFETFEEAAEFIESEKSQKSYFVRGHYVIEDIRDKVEDDQNTKQIYKEDIR